MVEEEHIERLIQQDKDAFKHFVVTYENMVYHIVLGFVNHAQDAEDLAQEVFVKAYQALPKFNQKSKISTWLYQIAVNQSLEYLKYQKRQKRKATWVNLFQQEKEIPDFVHPGVQLENKERAAVLNYAVNQLAEKQMVAFKLKHLDGFSYDEIAAIMKMSKSSVESLLFRAKQSLRKRLQNYYEKNK